MYTEKNYKSKKELVTAFASGRIIGVFQPGPFGSGPINGQECIEGPHYPEPHRFYVTVTCKDSVIVAIDGKTAEQTRVKLDKAEILKAMPLQTFDVYWSPEGRKIATVQAKNSRLAIRKAPKPYRKYLGEMYAVAVPSTNRPIGEGTI